MPLPTLPRLVYGSEKWPRGASEVPSILLPALPETPKARRQHRRLAKFKRRHPGLEVDSHLLPEAVDTIGHLPPLASGTDGHPPTVAPEVTTASTEERHKNRQSHISEIRKSRFGANTSKQAPRPTMLLNSRIAILRERLHTGNIEEWEGLAPSATESEEFSETPHVERDHKKRKHSRKVPSRSRPHSLGRPLGWKPDSQSEEPTLFQQVATSSDWSILDDQPPKLRRYCRDRLLNAFHASRAITIEEVLREAGRDDDEDLRSLAAQLLQEVARPRKELTPLPPVVAASIDDGENPVPGQELASSVRRKMRARVQAEFEEQLDKAKHRKSKRQVTLSLGTPRETSPAMSHGTKDTPRGHEEKDAETKMLASLAREHHKSKEEIKTLLALFRQLDTDGNAMLSREEFHHVVRHVHNMDADEAVPEDLADKHWQSLGKMERDGEWDFPTFVLWYVRASQAEEVLVPDQRERRIREITRAFGLYVSDVDAIKRIFDKYDTEKNGCLDQEEFRVMLADLMHVELSEMPKKKIQVYWCEIDLDQDGGVNFDEFLIWYCRRFQGERR
mmetsp:Transcript_71381/g.152531  ORF Transcript_71381/g.152531 Transcript_71381/m.152531 type:complete len:561 (-) Transcript_71381:104-1786(-)